MTQNPNFLLMLRFSQPVAIGFFAEVPVRSKHSAAARNAPAARSNLSKRPSASVRIRADLSDANGVMCGAGD
jgi:hypothetical protein